MKVRAPLLMLVCTMALLGVFALAGCGSDKLAVRESVNDYSWAELAALSSEIARASDDEDALQIAERYHLAYEGGMLDGTQAKDVELADGAHTRAVIAGFNHDERAGGGKAGITFIFEDTVALRRMNNIGIDSDLSERGGVYGGWVASELRGWLNDEFARELPDDLRAVLVDVVKASCVVSENDTYGFGSIDQSTESLIERSVDKLWLPALAEITGVAENTPAAKDSPEWVVPLRAEGAQYQLFSDVGVVEGEPNAVLVRKFADADSSSGGAACRWWLRSVEDITYCDVRADGSIHRRKNVVAAGERQGVVACFAI